MIYYLETNPVCAPYRVHTPSRALEKHGLATTKVVSLLDDQALTEMCDNASLVIIQRATFSQQLKFAIGTLQSHGVTVGYEIDDDLLHLDLDLNYAQRVGPGYLKAIVDAIGLCDFVQCSTDALATTLAEYHTKTIVLPNQLDVTHVGRRARNEAAPQTTIITYAAGENHDADWKEIADTYNQTIESLEKEGYATETRIVGSTKIFQSITTNHKRYYPCLSRDLYLALLAQSDICLGPLRDTRFNRAKSDVKFLETAAAGSCFLASDVAYNKTVEHLRTGFVYKNHTGFDAGIRELVRNYTLRRQLATASGRYVRAYRHIDHHIHDYFEKYVGLVPSLRQSRGATSLHLPDSQNQLSR